MEKIYLLLVFLSFILVVSDLILNVSLEGLKSLNSAISSKPVPVWLIFFLVGLGLFSGVTFSEEMIGVTRNGIFNPEQFVLAETISILLSVVFAEVLLMNLLRAYGVPASATISVIFGLCGASLAVAWSKMSGPGDFSLYINSEKLLAVILGILISVALAFIAGFLIQWVVRLIFTYQFKKKLPYLGALYAGISFFLVAGVVIHSIGNISFIPQGWIDILRNDKSMILIASSLGFFLLVQLIQLIFKKFDVLNLIILLGTFAISFAFAGNDFSILLGIPISIYDSFKAWTGAGAPSPDSFSTDFLNIPVINQPVILLFFAGAMFLGMIKNRNIPSRYFMKDDPNRNSETGEKLNTYPVSRSIVRGSFISAKRFGKHINPVIKHWINKRFTQYKGDGGSADKTSPDKIRTINILLISAVLISSGTYFQLPLASVYITFMVALGASLGDRTWDRESAISSVSGIFSMMGSWFFNSFLSLTLGAVLALFILYGGPVAAVVLGALTILSIIRAIIVQQKREVILQEVEEFPESTVKAESVLSKTNQDTSNAIIMISKAYFLGLNGFHLEDRKQLAEIDTEIEEFNQRMRKLKANIFKVIQKLQQDSIETGHYYVQIIDYLREMAHSIKFVVRPLYEHLGNSHKPFSEEQNEELMQFSSQINDFLNYSLYIIKESRFDQIEELIVKRQEINELMREMERRQIRRIKRKETNSRNSVLFFTLMSESKNLVLQTVNLLKATRDFVSYTKS